MNRLSLTDLLFNVLMAITLMLMILLMILQTKEADPAVKDMNKVIVTMDWDGTSDYDVDMWIQLPTKERVGFSRKEMNGVHLQKDDTGVKQDKVTDADGNVSWVHLNREILNLRTLIPGRYTVNAVLYSNKILTRKNDDPRAGITYDPVTLTSSLIQVNPFQQWSGQEHTISEGCAQVTLLAFDVNGLGEITVIEDAPFIRMRLPCNSGSSNYTPGELVP